jgi:drug/metabolite transporter (DMT)-like permease
MTPPAICLWIASVVLDTAGRVAFKSAAVTGDWKRKLRSPALAIGVVCFCLEFVVWLALLSLIPLSQAILIGSINIVTVALSGRVLFGERLDATRAAGVALIAIGVALAGGFP